jgi:hypothetical protein
VLGNEILFQQVLVVRRRVYETSWEQSGTSPSKSGCVASPVGDRSRRGKYEESFDYRSGYGFGAAMWLEGKRFDVIATVEICAPGRDLEAPSGRERSHLQSKKLDVTKNGHCRKAALRSISLNMLISSRLTSSVPCSWPKASRSRWSNAAWDALFGFRLERA